MTNFMVWEMARQKDETLRPTKASDLVLMERAYAAGRESMLPALKATCDLLHSTSAALSGAAGNIARYVEEES